MQCPADVPQFNKAIFFCCCPERASLLSSFARIGLKLDWSISSGFRGHYFSQHRLGHLRYYKGRWQRVKGRIEKNNRLQGLKRCKGTLFQFHMLVRYQCERTWLLTYNKIENAFILHHHKCCTQFTIPWTKWHRAVLNIWQARFSNPRGLVVDSDGSLLVADMKWRLLLLLLRKK